MASDQRNHECQLGEECPIHGSARGFVCSIHGRRELTIKNVRNYVNGYVCEVPHCHRQLQLKRLKTQEEELYA